MRTAVVAAGAAETERLVEVFLLVLLTRNLLFLTPKIPPRRSIFFVWFGLGFFVVFSGVRFFFFFLVEYRTLLAF